MYKTIITITAITIFATASYAGSGLRYITQPCDTIQESLLADESITDKDIKTEEIESSIKNDFNSTFEMPEGLSAGIDSLLNSWQARNLLNVLDCDTSNWKSILLNDTVYAQRLHSLPSIVEMQ